jgi:cation:H+ antiporter
MHASRASHVGSIGYSARLAVSIMLITLLLFLVSAVTIYLACEYFVNGIEWTGHHFKLSQSATGSLLAALGTALPECIVTLTALLMGNTTAQQEIGIGAALGGPLVLATIGYAAVGLTLLLCMGRTERAIDGEVATRDWPGSALVYRHFSGGDRVGTGRLYRQELAGPAFCAGLPRLCKARAETE